MSNRNFTVVWTTPAGRFGWTDLEDCDGPDDAASFWLDEHAAGRIGAPPDAQIDVVKPSASSASLLSQP